ncbi:MAG: hypothetical protein ACI94D_001215, partial [Neolewinella sp.]
NYFWRQQGQNKTVRNLVLFCSRSLNVLCTSGRALLLLQ